MQKLFSKKNTKKLVDIKTALTFAAQSQTKG
jgi:hypothetical protein